MSQRSILFPPIAHGLSAIYGRTQSVVLKGRIDQVTQLSLDERLLLTRNDASFERHGRTPSTLSAIIELRLWKLAQGRLFDPQSTRRLKPIHCFDGLSLQDVASEAMLDEAGPADFQDATVSLVDRRNSETTSEDPGFPTSLSRLGVEDEGLLLEIGDSCYDEMLDIDESSELGDDMLDDIWLGSNVIYEDDEAFPWEDEILDIDGDQYENMLKENILKIHTEDADIDLFQED